MSVFDRGRRVGSSADRFGYRFRRGPAAAALVAFLLVLFLAASALAGGNHDHRTEEHALGVLHPLLVHFPLALALVAALGVVAGFVFRGPFLRNWVTLTIVLAALFSVPTYLLGEEAEEAMGRMSAARKAMVEAHGTWGAAATYTLLGVAVIRLLTVRWSSSRGLLWISRLAVLGAAAVLAYTGYLGAEVVRGPNHMKGILPW